jgi:hypothetical protein
MKRKTYNNVLKATKMLETKGYDFNEASQMVINLFDTHVNKDKTIEFYIDKILPKGEWLAEQERYGTK